MSYKNILNAKLQSRKEAKNKNFVTLRHCILAFKSTYVDDIEPEQTAIEYLAFKIDSMYPKRKT